MNETLIKLDGITKVFLTDEIETHALSGIHLEIKQGEFISISGPSGCGKSTALKAFGNPAKPRVDHEVLQQSKYKPVRISYERPVLCPLLQGPSRFLM